MKSLDLDVPPFRRAVVERPGTIEPRIRDMNTSQPSEVSQVLNSQHTQEMYEIDERSKAMSAFLLELGKYNRHGNPTGIST